MSRNALIAVVAAVVVVGFAAVSLFTGRSGEASKGSGEGPPAGPPAAPRGPETDVVSSRADLPSVPDEDPAFRRALDEGVEQARGDLPHAVEGLLAWAETEEGVARLLRELQASDDTDRKALVLTALGKSPLEVGRNVVLDAARGDFGADVRAPALLLLGEDRRPETTELLGRTALEESDPAIAATAFQGLVFQNTPDAHRRVGDLLTRITDPERRRLAWIAIAGDPVPPPAGESEVPTEIRRAVHSVLVPLPEDEEAGAVLEQIVGQARSERTPGGRMFAATALMMVPDDRTVEPFLEMWGDLDPPMREMLAGRVRPDFSAPKIPGMLRSAAEEGDPRVRAILADRAGELAGPDSLAILESWREKETEAGIRNSLDAAIRAIRERQ